MLAIALDKACGAHQAMQIAKTEHCQKSHGLSSSKVPSYNANE
jgi:hypothetical protein